MNAVDLRRVAQPTLWIVIFFTVVGLIIGQAACVRGVWLALLWQAASVWCFWRIAQLLLPPLSRRRMWALAGWLLLKFPLLYTLGWYLLQAWHPNALGLAVGLTLPWLVLLVLAVPSLMPSEPL